MAGSVPARLSGRQAGRVPNSALFAGL